MLTPTQKLKHLISVHYLCAHCNTFSLNTVELHLILKIELHTFHCVLSTYSSHLRSSHYLIKNRWEKNAGQVQAFSKEQNAKGQQTHEKILRKTDHQENANKKKQWAFPSPKLEQLSPQNPKAINARRIEKIHAYNVQLKCNQIQPLWKTM